MSQDQWEEVGSGNLVGWKEPRTIEGIYQGFVEVKSQYGKPENNGMQNKHSLLADDETLLEFYAPAILERKLSDPRVKVGARIRIVYDGTQEKTTGGRMAKSFVVQVAGA